MDTYKYTQIYFSVYLVGVYNSYIFMLFFGSGIVRPLFFFSEFHSSFLFYRHITFTEGGTIHVYKIKSIVKSYTDYFPYKEGSKITRKFVVRLG